MNNHLPYVALAIILILLSTFSYPAHAQTANGQKLDKFAPDFWSNTKVPKTFYALKEPVDLPGFPAYSGKVKFLNGLMESNADGGATYQMSLLSKDDPKQVMDWYYSMLRSNNWQLRASSPNNIAASNNNHDRCTIAVSPSNTSIKGQRYKSKLTMIYRQKPTKK